jgi:hypothetical protein
MAAFMCEGAHLGEESDGQPGERQRARQQAGQPPGYGDARHEQPQEDHMPRAAGDEGEVVQSAEGGGLGEHLRA